MKLSKENAKPIYVTMYVDKCNIEYFKTSVDKRKDEIRNIAKRLVKNPAAYDNMKYGLEGSARHYNCSIYQFEDSKLDHKKPPFFEKMVVFL